MKSKIENDRKFTGSKKKKTQKVLWITSYFVIYGNRKFIVEPTSVAVGNVIPDGVTCLRGGQESFSVVRFFFWQQSLIVIINKGISGNKRRFKFPNLGVGIFISNLSWRRWRCRCGHCTVCVGAGRRTRRNFYSRSFECRQTKRRRWCCRSCRRSDFRFSGWWSLRQCQGNFSGIVSE